MHCQRRADRRLPACAVPPASTGTDARQATHTVSQDRNPYRRIASASLVLALPERETALALSAIKGCLVRAMMARI